VNHKDDEDEIVILDDYSDNEDTVKILDAMVSIYEIKFEQRHLYEDFAGQKNYLRKMCSGEYIFNLDADEIPHKFLIENVKGILENNPEVDLFLVPRINIVEGLIEEHAKKWGWKINENGWINFPDWQGRVWKNRSSIRWTKVVHEMLSGYKEYSFLPAEEQFSLYHLKTIKKQEEQNAFYERIISG
jgi:glycosyltransferase involved in cell wall biosynthesis